LDGKQLDDDDREDEKRDNGSLEHVSANSERDESERELFQDVILATRVNSHRKDTVARRTHPSRLYVFLTVFPVQKLVVSRREHVDDNDGFGEEHDGEGDDVERSRRYHFAGRRLRRAVQHARRLFLSEWIRKLRLRCI
jgi:hypothetical protein